MCSFLFHRDENLSAEHQSLVLFLKLSSLSLSSECPTESQFKNTPGTFLIEGTDGFYPLWRQNVSVLWNRGSKPQSNWTPLLKGHFEVHCTSFNNGTKRCWGSVAVCLFQFSQNCSFFFIDSDLLRVRRARKIWKRGKLKNMLTHW